MPCEDLNFDISPLDHNHIRLFEKKTFSLSLNLAKMFALNILTKLLKLLGMQIFLSIALIIKDKSEYAAN